MQQASTSSSFDDGRSQNSSDDSLIASALDSGGEEEKKYQDKNDNGSPGGRGSGRGRARGRGGGRPDVDDVIDDIVGGGGDPESPIASRIDNDRYNYNPIGMTIGNLNYSPTPSTSSGGDGDGSGAVTAYGRNQSHAIHSSVHMHVQENAKISTYNLPVDRSNSTKMKKNNFTIGTNARTAATTATTTTTDGGDGLGPQRVDDISGGDVDIDNNSLLGDSMLELFLNKESTFRRSLDLNYEFLGSLPTDTRFDGQRRFSGGSGSGGSLNKARAQRQQSLDEETQMEMDALTAAIDPTPWSEIEGKINADVRNARMKSTFPSAARAPTQQHPHHSSYYPYGRHHQLPIPGKPVSPPRGSSSSTTTTAEAAAVAAAEAVANGSGMIDALATAAALAAAASVTGGANSSSNDDITAFPAGKSGANAATQHTSGQSVPQTTNAYSIFNRHTYQRHSANSTAQPKHSTAHTTNKASVLAAANQKSQYGFGGNHTVPSVPAPPPQQQWTVKNPLDSRYNKAGNTATGSLNLGARPSFQSTSNVGGPKLPMQVQPGAAAAKAAAAASSLLYKKIPPPPIAATMPHDAMDDTNNNSGTSYERKKQRAKDARVKLNESIERLHIAMGLAGSQSKQRIEQLKNGSLLMTDLRHKSIQINEECARLADQAKKWDRPSFVGTAASIIQSLNAECESLMLELYSMQAMRNVQQLQLHGQPQQQPAEVLSNNIMNGQDRSHHISELSGDQMSHPPRTYPALLDTSKGVSAASTNTSFVPSPTSRPDNKRREHPSESLPIGSPSKRQRGTQQDGSGTDLSSSPGTNTDDDTIVDETIIFYSVAKLLDPVTLCRCRTVSKKWSELPGFIDHDLWLSLAVKRFGFYNVRQWTEKLEDVDNGGGKVPGMILYKEMNSANVMPHFVHEGLSLLGDAMIPGRASGWVFLVERSNGETLRSVRQEPSGAEGAVSTTYESRPVVELRIMIQNTGMGTQPILLKNQVVAVDVSTRRSGGEMKEIDWDNRFRKVVRNLDGTVRRPRTNVNTSGNAGTGEIICQLDLFETAVIEAHINARGCSTTSKFQQRSNFTKLLVTLDGTTVPLVIPFLRDHHHGMH
jgi:hypothetical protein